LVFDPRTVLQVGVAANAQPAKTAPAHKAKIDLIKNDGILATFSSPAAFFLLVTAFPRIDQQSAAWSAEKQYHVTEL